MKSFEFSINDHTYTGETASAKNQFEALHVTARTGVAALLTESPSPKAMALVLMGAPFEELKRLRDLLLKGCVVKEQTGTDEGLPVAENLFADQIHNYYLLLAHVIINNLGGFSELRQQAEQQVQAEQKQ